MKKFKLWQFLLILVVIAVGVYFLIPKILGDTVYPLKYEGIIVKYAEEYDVDAALVAAVILQESRFNSRALSPKGATGLMQLMPGTAAGIANSLGVKSYNLYDPETSINFGTFYLKEKLDKYNGDLDATLSSYNAGSGNTDRWIKLNILSNIPFRETNNYVKKVKNYRTVYASMYAEQLGLPNMLEVSKEESANYSSKMRGFVWSEIFGGVFNTFSKDESD